MKIALVQDWLTVNGGAEKVVKEIIETIDNHEIEIFSLIDFLNEEDRQFILKGRKVNTSFLQYFPLAKYKYRNYLPFFPAAIESLNLEKFDLIITSSYAVAKGIKKRPDQLHICYCHSPMRYAWDLETEYLSQLNPLKQFLIKQILTHLRKWDVKTTKSVDVFISNSQNVSNRIKRIYNRESTVIFPPVDNTFFSPDLNKENYYFTSARLVSYKKTDLIINVFNELPHLKLIISGEGPCLETLKAIAGPNISFTGYSSREEIKHLMQKSKAFILAANEDFGITSLEAQSCATPIIALREGGYLETVIENKTGVFFDKQEISSLKSVILNFEKNNPKFELNDFVENVENFSKLKFRSRFQKILETYVRNF